ncbi:MAG: MATE family efflux transporter [Dehalococcoidales bacterium]|nr:MATE family efflux transporter [Dehalococcoidales bacterium]
MNKHTVFDTDNVGKLLLKLTIPAFIGMAVITLYNVVDTIFVGHYVGKLGIAALSVVFPVQMLSMGIGHMTGMGGAALISMAIGSNEIRRAERILGNAITPTIVFSAILMIFGLSNTDFWLRLIGASESVLPYASDYLRIILIGMFFQTFAMAFNVFIRAEGNVRVPMISMIIGAVLNIILDAIFIIPLGMGVAGAAWATIISQLVSVIYCLYYYLAGRSFLKIYLKNLLIDWRILGSILAIGISSFIMMMATSICAIIINRVLNQYGGDIAISAYGIINRIVMFALIPGMVIGQGLQPILGFNYGAKRYDRGLKVIKIAITAATVCCMAAFIVLYFFPGFFARIFNNDPELISLTVYGARRIFVTMPLIGFMMIGSTMFQALGKPIQAFLSSVSRTVLFLLPAVLILPNYWQLDGVWLAFPITDALTFILILILFIPQIRQLVRLRKGQADKKDSLQAGRYEEAGSF